MDRPNHLSQAHLLVRSHFHFDKFQFLLTYWIGWPQALKLEDKLEGIENFLAWNYRIGLILGENDLENYIKDEVAEPKEHEAEEKHRKYLIKEMGIIVDSIKVHLIPQVSSKKTPKQMYDALSKIYEGRNIN